MNPIVIKYLTRLRVGLSHLREHKFKHNFQDTLNPLCACSSEPECNKHYLLRCHFFNEQRVRLFDSLNAIDNTIAVLPEIKLVRVLLYGEPSYCEIDNKKITSATITSLIASCRFDESFM